MSNETRECRECHKTKSESMFAWVRDRYGLPWRKVCDDCFDKVREDILGWQFDPADAGESLEAE